jgi:hypothetical protein
MPEVSRLNCPSCGASLSVNQKTSKVLACSYCGSVIDLKNSSHPILEQLDVVKFAPQSFLKLGMIGRVEGVDYQIIGRICYSSTIREWDFEDKKYYAEPWNFDSWILVNDKREFLYLAEDKEGFSLSRSFTPSAPKIPKPDDQYISFFSSGDLRIILEHTQARIDYFEGEFSWAPTIGTVVCQAEAGAEHDTDERRRSVEWRLDPETGEVDEVEFFNSKPISKLDLARGFNVKEVIQAEEAREKHKKEIMTWAKAFYAAALLFAVLMIIALMRDGKLIAKHQADLTVVDGTELVYGPMQLSRKGSLYKIVLTTSIPDNSWSWGGVELLDGSQQTINSVSKEFFRESGRDSEGPWSESVTRTSQLFKLSKTGEYYLRLIGEKGTASRGKLTVSVYEGLTLARYYLLGMLFCLGYAVAMQYYKSLNPTLMVVGLFAFVILILSNIEADD